MKKYKTCSTCNRELSVTEFHKRKNAPLGVKSSCKKCCREWQQNHYYSQGGKEKRIKRQSSPEYQKYIRKFRLKTKYGLTVSDYEEMLKTQNYSCAICRSTELKGSRSDHYLNVDHCHKTDKVRGLLCGFCNTALGKLKEDISIMESMINYVKRYSYEYQEGSDEGDRGESSEDPSTASESQD